MSPRRGILVIISSPSGAGKTTLAHRLLDGFPTLQFSISYTTRPPRKDEKNGVDYYFVSPEKFDKMVAAGQFAEWAEVHDHHYGTLRSAVEGALADSHDVVFDVDYQGGRSLRQQWPEDALDIFILPPDLEALAARLRQRATDTEEVITQRLDNALKELSFHKEYQHQVINDDLEDAYAILRAIYLVRRDGTSDSPSSLVALSDESKGAHAREHAARLIASICPKPMDS